MVANDADGRIIFELDCPGASSVEVVGDFFGWHHQPIPLTLEADGRWRGRIDPRPGAYAFRYLINGHLWALDASLPTTFSTAHSCEMCVIHRPGSRPMLIDAA